MTWDSSSKTQVTKTWDPMSKTQVTNTWDPVSKTHVIDIAPPVVVAPPPKKSRDRTCCIVCFVLILLCALALLTLGCLYFTESWLFAPDDADSDDVDSPVTVQPPTPPKKRLTVRDPTPPKKRDPPKQREPVEPLPRRKFKRRKVPPFQRAKVLPPRKPFGRPMNAKLHRESWRVGAYMAGNHD